MIIDKHVLVEVAGNVNQPVSACGHSEWMMNEARKLRNTIAVMKKPIQAY